MTEPRVIRADYANWRPVAGRKVLQLVFEVPIEQTEDVMAKLGVPMPGESRWCAVALLESNGSANGSADGKPRSVPRRSDGIGAPEIPHGSTPPLTPASTAAAGTLEIPEAKDRRPFASLPLSQQAALRCKDATFQDFMCHYYWNTMAEADEAYTTQLVKDAIGFESRSALDDPVNAEAIETWGNIEGRYQSWRTDQRYATVAR